MKAEIVALRQVTPALRERWRELAQRAVEPNPYVEPEMVLPAARWLERGATAALVVVEGGGDLLFALPVASRSSVRRIPVPAVGTWSHAHFALGTPLVAAQDAEAVCAEAFRALEGTAPWAVLDLVTADGPVAAAARAAAARRRRIGELRLPDRPVVHRRPQPSYLDGTTSRRRLRGLRRLARRLEAELGGPPECVDQALLTAGALPRAIEAFLDMEAAGWKGAAGGAMRCRPGHAEFFADMCEEFAKRGRLELWSYGTPGRAVAYQCNLRARDAVFHFKVAYDETCARYSPGIQLELAMLDRFHEDQGLRLVESGVGTAPTPSHQLYPDRRPLSDLFVPLDNPVGHAAARATPAVAAVYRSAKRLAGRTGEPARARGGHLLPLGEA